MLAHVRLDNRTTNHLQIHLVMLITKRAAEQAAARALLARMEADND